MRVTIIARTAFIPDNAEDSTGGQWEADGSEDASQLSEFSGRSCYESWSKPNPATADNRSYLAHIIEQKHFSVLEHGSVTFRITEVSRSLTHELIRHRHMSPSQLSQRFARLEMSTQLVVPPLYRFLWQTDPTMPVSETQGIVEQVWTDAIAAYDKLVNIWEGVLRTQGVTGTALKKESREAARCVLPNMTPTAVVLTGNHRTWREFLEKRGSLHADAEIRELAVELYSWLAGVEPNLYQDFYPTQDDRGRDYLGRHGETNA